MNELDAERDDYRTKVLRLVDAIKSMEPYFFSLKHVALDELDELKQAIAEVENDS